MTNGDYKAMRALVQRGDDSETVRINGRLYDQFSAELALSAHTGCSCGEAYETRAPKASKCLYCVGA